MKRSSYYLFHVTILLPESLSMSFKMVENRGTEWPKKGKKVSDGIVFYHSSISRRRKSFYLKLSTKNIFITLASKLYLSVNSQSKSIYRNKILNNIYLRKFRGPCITEQLHHAFFGKNMIIRIRINAIWRC